MKGPGIRCFGFPAALMAAWMGMLATGGWCDTIVLKGGYKFICEIHPDNRTFKHDPNQWVEFEIGSWILDIQRYMVESVAEDDLYVPPQTEAERKKAEETIQRIREIQQKIEQGGVEQTAALGAEITYLVNFAAISTVGRSDTVPAKLGDMLPEGSALTVKQNSRADAAIGERARIGIRAGTTVEFLKMKQVVKGAQTLWSLGFGLPSGGIWIELKGIGGGEAVELQVAGASFQVASDTLISVTSALGTGYALAYWRGTGDLTVRAPEHVGGGGLIIRPGYMVTFGAAGSAATERRLKPEGEEEWNRWRGFQPVTFDLQFRLLPPPLEPLPSEDVLYSLREARVTGSVEIRGEVRTNVLQDLGVYAGALEVFEKDTGRYPTVEEGLEALRKDPGVDGWQGPYVGEEVQRLDPWGNPYRYRLLGQGDGAVPVVYSGGQNKVDEYGLGDDVH